MRVAASFFSVAIKFYSVLMIQGGDPKNSVPKMAQLASTVTVRRNLHRIIGNDILASQMLKRAYTEHNQVDSQAIKSIESLDEEVLE